MKNIKKFLNYCDNWIVSNDDIKTINSMLNRYTEQELKYLDYEVRLIYKINIQSKKDYKNFIKECKQSIEDDDNSTLLLDLLLSKPGYAKFNKISDLFYGQVGGQLAYASKSNIGLSECYNIVLEEYNSYKGVK